MDVVARVVCVRWRGWRFIIKGLFQHLLSRVLSALVHSPRLFHIATFLPPHLEVALVTLQQAGENNQKRKNPGDRFIVVIILRQISWDDCGRNLTYELFHFYPPPLTLAAVIYIRWGLSFTVQGSRGTRVGGKSVLAMERDPSPRSRSFRVLSVVTRKNCNRLDRKEIKFRFVELMEIVGPPPSFSSNN